MQNHPSECLYVFRNPQHEYHSSPIPISLYTILDRESAMELGRDRVTIEAMSHTRHQ